MSFTLFDILILTILTISSTLGIYRGLIKLSISFIAFIGSIFSAYFLYPFVADFFSKYFSHQLVLITLSASVSYVLSLAVLGFLSSKLSSMVENVSGGMIDRFLGLFAGFIRGSLVCLALFQIIAIVTTKSYVNAETAEDIFLATTIDKYPEWLTKSITLKYLDDTSRTIITRVITEDMLKSIEFKKQEPKEE